LLVPLEQVITVIDPNNWAISREAMYRTAHQEHGTARGAFLGASYTIGGKTGTQQVINIAAGQKYNAKAINARHRDNAMFIGFAPHQKPEVTIAVVVENAGGGGSNAAPVARQMLDYYFSPQFNAPTLPSVADIALMQQQRYDAMIVREQRYAEEALQEKAAKEQRKALEKLRQSNPEQSNDAVDAETLTPNSATPPPAATTNTAITPEPASETEEKPIDD
jgi:penicillin-binding protein 2